MPEPVHWDNFLDEDWGETHRRIVADCVTTVSFDEAVSLVGILFDFKIKLSDELRAMALRAEMVELDDVGPLEPHASAILIGKLFHLDCDALYRQFHQCWRQMKKSPTVEHVKAVLESHSHVGKLVRHSPLK
jgi:hypothetical protein